MHKQAKATVQNALHKCLPKDTTYQTCYATTQKPKAQLLTSHRSC